MFRDKEWVLSPDAFELDRETMRLIAALGPALRAFQKACNKLYLSAADDVQHGWVAKLIDQGKPAELVELSRHPRFRDALPGVIRPDLVLTDTGVAITELDSIPGGIGLTGWLNETFARMGQAVIGGEHGMLDAFATAFPKEDIVISAESADYQPEMQWLVDRLNERNSSRPRRVIAANDLQPSELPGLAIYRFFELFDLANVPLSAEMLKLAVEGELQLTPPPKPFIEEKMWLALFWSPQLSDFWQRALSSEHRELLQRCIPRGWVVDPTPLPPFAVYPRLNIQSWNEARRFGGKQRELALKISGFSERGWGSRGVFIGHDLSQEQWSAALDDAQASFPTNPFVLQEFHRAKVVLHPAWNEERQGTVMMKSRVRLCPYYFAAAGTDDMHLGGVLATVCPADKKILHGMRDAMMLPCVLGG